VGPDAARRWISYWRPGETRLDLGQLELTADELAALIPLIAGLEGLTELNLVGNRLETLPESIADLTSLTQLMARSNALRTLPDTIGALPGLQILDVAENRLTALPASLGQLSSLTTLWIGQNRLLSLPDEIGALSALEELDLGNNELGALPDTIGALSALTSLTASGNQLLMLPAAVCDLGQLRHLHLSGNRLTALPDRFGALGALTRLDLSWNDIAQLPEGFENLTALRWLQLAANRLPVEPVPEVIARLPQLEDFDYGRQQGYQPPDYSAAAVIPRWAEQTGAESSPGRSSTEAILHASYYQYELQDRLADPDYAALGDTRDGVLGTDGRCISITTGTHTAAIPVIFTVAEHLPIPEGVASACDLWLADGQLSLLHWGGGSAHAHSFGRPTRCRILVEVAMRDDEFQPEGRRERHRITVVATSTPRPRWRSVLIDRIGADLANVIDHVGEWHPDAEP
jgi:hypothetical protein